MMKITIKEIKEKYLYDKPDEKRFVWTYYVRRPLSYYMAWPFLRLGISANVVTLLWLFVGITGCIFLTTGNYVYMIIGALLLEFSTVLDAVDGHIARFKGPTYLGGILDVWAGEIVLIGSMFSLGIGLSKANTVSFGIMPLTGLGNDLLLFAGFFAALASLSAWAVRVHWRSLAVKFSWSDRDPDKNFRISRKVLIIDNLFHYVGAYAPIMAISAVFQIMDIFILLIALVYSVFLLKLMVTVVRTVRSVEHQRFSSNS